MDKTHIWYRDKDGLHKLKKIDFYGRIYEFHKEGNKIVLEQKNLGD